MRQSGAALEEGALNLVIVSSELTAARGVTARGKGGSWIPVRRRVRLRGSKYDLIVH